MRVRTYALPEFVLIGNRHMATKTTTTTTSAALASITNYYRILVETQPDASQLANEALRVDLSSTTLAEALRGIYQSPSRANGRADEVAEAFFLFFNRAPDPATYNIAMDMLRSGKTLADVMDLVLAMPGHRLSNTGFSSDSDFIKAAYALLTGGETLTDITVASFANLISMGLTSRAKLLAAALESTDPLFHGGREKQVQTALVYMAAAGQEANTINLSLATGDLFADILSALTAGGFSATSGKPYFVRPDATGSTLQIKGELTAELLMNMQTASFTLGGVKKFPALLSMDGGFDAGIVAFESFHAQGVTTIDASAASGAGKLNFIGKTGGDAYTIQAPASGSTLQGADGNDVLVGGGGSDNLVATDGTDTLTGNAGVDTFVFARSSSYMGSLGATMTNITDYGNGADILDFSLLLGASAPKSSSIRGILATSTAAATLANGGVALIENNGAWVGTGGAAPATEDNVAALFAAAGMPFLNPTTASRHIIITADLVNDANVWLVNNSADVTAVTSDEIFLVGHITGDWNVMLNQLLPVVK